MGTDGGEQNSLVSSDHHTVDPSSKLPTPPTYIPPTEETLVLISEFAYTEKSLTYWCLLFLIICTWERNGLVLSSVYSFARGKREE